MGICKYKQLVRLVYATMFLIGLFPITQACAFLLEADLFLMSSTSRTRRILVKQLQQHTHLLPYALHIYRERKALIDMLIQQLLLLRIQISLRLNSNDFHVFHLDPKCTTS